jgi:hypothetical protein
LIPALLGVKTVSVTQDPFEERVGRDFIFALGFPISLLQEPGDIFRGRGHAGLIQDPQGLIVLPIVRRCLVVGLRLADGGPTKQKEQ